MLGFFNKIKNKKVDILNRSINNLIETFQKSNIEEWTYILGSKKEIIKRNLIAGIFRGVGIGIGVTIIMTKSFAFSYSQQIIFAHNSQNCFVVDHKSRFSQQPYLNTAIAIGSMCFLVAFHD